MAFLDYTGLRYFYGKVLARIKGLTADDVGAATPSYVNDKVAGFVPNSRKINNKDLTADLTLSASDVGATTKSYVDSQVGAITPAGIGAATPSYVDQQIAQMASAGVPKLMVYPLEQVATTEGQTTFPINLDTFVAETDTVFVQSGRTMLSPVSDFTISGKNIVLNEGVPKDRTVTIYVFKNVPIGEEGSISGAVLLNKSVTADKLTEEYLRLTGGTLTGNVGLDRDGDAIIRVGSKSANRDFHFVSSINGYCAITSRDKANSGNVSSIRLYPETTKLSNILKMSIGVDDEYTNYNLFGQHNKPSGSYTGTGDATEFTIDTGGIGYYLAVTGNGGNFIVGWNGAFGCRYDKDEALRISQDDVTYRNSILTIKSTGFLNILGSNYTWQVL